MRHLFKRSDDSLVVRKNEPVVFTEKVPAYQHISIECSTKMKVWDDQGNTFEVPSGDTFTYSNDTGKGVMVSYQPVYTEKCPNRPPVKMPVPPPPKKIGDLQEGESGYVNYVSLYRLNNNDLVLDLLDPVSGHKHTGPKVTRVCDGWEVDFSRVDSWSRLNARNWLRNQIPPLYTKHKGPIVELTGLDLT